MKRSDNAVLAIRNASRESQVVEAVQAYLASLDASELALLPEQIVTLALHQTEEVIQSALDLVHREMQGLREAPGAALLSETALVFSTAANRLAALAKDAV
jgi:hypothetical protein